LVAAADEQTEAAGYLQRVADRLALLGLTVEVVQDAVRAGTFRTNGSFGWDGAFGTHFFVDPREKLVAVLLIQTSGRDIHRDFETAVMQSIID